MRREDQEADYLVPTQLEVDPESFEAVVEEAFRLEYGVKQKQEFAEVMGVDKSRITQIFQAPENLQPESIRNLLSFFKLRKSRTRILKAWNKRAFGDSLSGPKQGRITAGKLDELAMRTLQRMVRQSRMERAAQLAYELSRKGVTLELRENALDLLCWCHQRLDQPGQAMAAARRIIEGAKSRNEPHRAARGHLFRARILISLADSTPEEFDPALDEAERLASFPGAPSKPEYSIATLQMVAAYRQSSRVVFMERGIISVDDGFLEIVLQNSLKEAKVERAYQKRYQAWQMVSRVYLLRGEHFAASEAIEKAFASGELKNLNALEMSAVLTSRVHAESEEPKSAIRYLTRAAKRCRDFEDRYHQRLVEWQLARLHSKEL